MAGVTGSVWAIDLGNSSIKAMRLSDIGGILEVTDFEIIEHGKILTGKGVEDLEKQELIALTFRQFVQAHNIDKDDVIISLPSQNSFARFVNLPPVEQKRIPEIIRFEAVQQIPFNIEEVQWDWQLMGKDSSGENRVGIFAIKSDVIDSTLEYFSRENIQVKFIQMSPMALYNYAIYDRAELSDSDSDEGIVILNIGAEYSDLVICTRSTVWQRCIPMGGNSFTKAISDAFKISFEKAEKLKRNAAVSKYARQLLQAMKPVFSNFASEIQRSIGFYSSSNPKTKITKVVATGGGTKMRGLLKYLQQSLQMPIERPDSFTKLAVSPDLSAAKFHESVCDLAIVYGLGLQALGLAKVESNLLPKSIARSMAWAAKSHYFVAAAALLLIISILSFVRVQLDKVSYRAGADERRKIEHTIESARQAESNLQAQKDKEQVSQAMVDKQLALFKNREVVPQLIQTILSTVPNQKNNPEQIELYRAFEKGDVETVLKTKRSERKQLFITGLSVRFVDDLATAAFDEKDLAASGRTITAYSNVATSGEAAATSVDESLRLLTLKRMGAGAAETAAPKPRERPADRAAAAAAAAAQAQQLKSNAGFVVSIIGYSPYGEISKLLDPIGVGNRQQEWGFITRLKHLGEVSDVNCFALYDANDIRNFKWQPIHEMDLAASVPAGIGVVSQRVIEVKKSEAERRLPTPYGRITAEPSKIRENILIDPMTKEIMSKVFKYDENGSKVTDQRSGKIIYEVNDHWFEIKAKFLWKDVPQEILQMAKGK